ncbi:MAG: anti-sigma factor [Chitinophagaceae bacterium]
MSDQDPISSEMIEQYVLGLCTPEEKAALDQQRLQDPVLHQAILDAELQLENFFLRNAVQPPASTDQAILQGLNKVAPAQAVIRPIHNARNWWKRIAAVSTGMLLLSGIGNFTQFQKNRQQLQEIARLSSQPQTLPVADFAVMRNPRITPVAMMGVGIHSICRCTMYWDKQTGKVYIMIHHLPATSGQQDYQLWAWVDGKPVSVGIVNDSIRDRFIEINGMPAGATEFTVTLEPANGSSSPTVAETYLSGKI